MMTGNPLSGHTNHNLSALSGTASAVDGLADGDHIVSPTLTNILEGVHGNGVILEEDTANGATNRSVPENLPGICEQVTNTYTFTVTGGHAVIDGLVYAFAGGAGSSDDIPITTSSAHKTGSPSALSAGQEALVIVYVSSDGGSADNIYWELGTPVTAAANTYPSAPSSFLNFPDASLTVKQSVVLAVLRVVYSSGGGDLKLSITESNDKRVFVRPSPVYFTPVTTGAVGAANAPVDLHTELDNLHGGGDEAGNLTASRLGAMWQSHGAQIGSTTAGDNQKDVLYYSGNHAARYTRSVFDRILTSTATSIDITSADASILILTPGGAGTVTTSGAFPAGYQVQIENLHASNDLTFALTNSTTSTVKAGGYGKFVCTTSHASDPTFVRINPDMVGLHSIWVPAEAISPRDNAGCADLATTAATTNGRPDIRALGFDTSSDEHAQFTIAMPKMWNEGTVTAAFYWTAASGSGTVQWAIQGVSLSEGDAIDTAFGTAVLPAADTLTTTKDVHISATTGAITIGGSPAAEDLTCFQVYRDVSGDNLGVDALLLGVKIFYTINARNDA